MVISLGFLKMDVKVITEWCYNSSPDSSVPTLKAYEDH